MFWRLLNAVCASLVISVFVEAESATITSAECLPLADGDYWACDVNDVPTLTVTVIPGTALINSVAAKGLQQSDGEIDYLASDMDGIASLSDSNQTKTLVLTTRNIVPPI